jgi:excisionase family DNA binding protein
MHNSRSRKMKTLDVITTDELARLLHVSANTVRYWKHRGTGPQSFKVGKRILYKSEDVDAWIAEQYTKGVAQHSTRANTA